MLYRTLFIIDVLICLVIAGFFLFGVADGSVGPFNMALWVILLGIPAVMLFFGMKLNQVGRTGAATALLAVLAIPGVLGVGFVVLMIVLFTLNPGSFR